MTTLGIIGTGSIGTAIARLAIAAGLEVVLSNSRGPESLAAKIADLGSGARAATPEQAAEAGDQVVVSVPLAAYRSMPVAALQGKVVVDTINYYATRDGHIADLDSGHITTPEGRAGRTSEPLEDEDARVELGGRADGDGRTTTMSVDDGSGTGPGPGTP